jgi:hypothetical protein
MSDQEHAKVLREMADDMLMDEHSRSSYLRAVAKSASLEAGAAALERTWQPIETAPKATRVLVWLNGRVEVAEYANPMEGTPKDAGHWWWVPDDNEFVTSDVHPTHWMPLPDPPKEQP